MLISTYVLHRSSTFFKQAKKQFKELKINTLKKSPVLCIFNVHYVGFALLVIKHLIFVKQIKSLTQ